MELATEEPSVHPEVICLLSFCTDRAHPSRQHCIGPGKPCMHSGVIRVSWPCLSFRCRTWCMRCRVRCFLGAAAVHYIPGDASCVLQPRLSSLSECAAAEGSDAGPGIQSAPADPLWHAHQAAQAVGLLPRADADAQHLMGSSLSWHACAVHVHG